MLSKSKPTAILTVAGICLVATVSIFSSHLNRNDAEKLVPGNWTFMCVPDNTPAAKSAAVKVIGVGTNASAGAAIGHLLINNRGDHEIRGVTLHWSLSKGSSNPDTLLEGKTAIFDISIPPGQTKELDRIGISFAKLQKQLPPESLTGAFKLTIGVAEALYDDGTKWRLGQTAPKILNRKVSMDLCGNSGCVLMNDTYFCGSNKDTSCATGSNESGPWCFVMDCQIN